MKRLVFLLAIGVLAGCNSQSRTYSFELKEIRKYPVGKRTIRYTYNEPFLFIITRYKYDKEVNGYRFSHELSIIKFPEFDTVDVIRGTNIEQFILWKISEDTIIGFIGDGIPDKGPVLDHFKNVRLVKVLIGRGVIYDTILYVIKGKVGGARNLWLFNNGERDYLLFDYDYRLHLLDLSTFKYLGHTREMSTFITPVYFKGNELITSVVLGRLPGHRNDLYLERFDIKKMKIKKLLTVFEDTFRNVYAVVPFGSKDNFVFTAGDGMFAHHIYTFYKGKYKLVFSFPDNTVPFIAGIGTKKCNVFAASLGHPYSFYSYKMMVGALVKDHLISMKEVPLSSEVDFIYPPVFYSAGDGKALLIFDVFNKKWTTDTLYWVKFSCYSQ